MWQQDVSNVCGTCRVFRRFRFSFLKTYTSYSIFFFGEKYAVSFSHALSKSSDSPVSVKVSNNYVIYLFTHVIVAFRSSMSADVEHCMLV